MRRVLELLGDRAVVAHHQPGRERQHDGRVGQHQRPWVLISLQLDQDGVQRDEHQRGGHQVRDQDRGAERTGAAPAQPHQRVRAQAGRQTEMRADERDEDRVARTRSQNGVCVNRNTNCSSVHGSGQNMLWICWIWSVLLNAVTKMK